MSPKLSVIIPTYNRQESLERAVNSVLNQTFQDFEILICDDASTDQTQAIARTYHQRDSRVKLLCLPENRGAGAARNLGMRAARGDYIAFLDSDDEWLPEKLSRQLAQMDGQPPEVGVCFCGAQIIRYGVSIRVAKYVPQPSWEQDTYRKFVLDRIPFVTSTVLFRRSCLEATGLMIPQMRRNQDGEFLLRLLRHSGLSVLPDCLVKMHLVISSSKAIYERMKPAASFRESHVAHIRAEHGRWVAIYYQARIRMNLSAGAFRERRWLEGCRQLARRLAVFPVLFPSDCVRLAKAFGRAILG